MDLTTFYATVSGIGFTLLGLWWVVVDKHPEWFADATSALMAYVVSLHFMIPGSSSLLSLVAPDVKAVWRVVFSLLGVSGVVGAVLVARQLGRSRVRWAGVAMALALPVYAAVVLVALVPDAADLVDLAPLQVEAILISLVLLLGLHAAWFFNHQQVTPATKEPAPRAH
jgi:hypothetical protein